MLTYWTSAVRLIPDGMCVARAVGVGTATDSRGGLSSVGGTVAWCSRDGTEDFVQMISLGWGEAELQWQRSDKRLRTDDW